MSGQERIALFIDGANLYATAKTLGFDIDYKRLLGEFRGKGTLVRAFYYTALIEDQEYSSIRPLIDWLDYNGYRVVTKPTKEFVDSLGRRKIKGNMDIEIAVDALELAPHITHRVLFSGDGDFRSLVEAVQRKGVKVSVVSTVTTQPPMVADDLRRQADEFIDLAKLSDRVGRDPIDRPDRVDRPDRIERPERVERLPRFVQGEAGETPVERVVRAPRAERPSYGRVTRETTSSDE
ncbi:MAG: NYN domain-containing protein [Beijerinckiaceae bacterium]